ncbi:Two-component transcriptional regulator [Salmonella bongori]|nr:Two-component transcriptional regulator [Salmonella bongori]
MTGRCDQIDRIVGWRWARDDYVTKRWNCASWLVRVKNLLWRIDLAHPTPQSVNENCYVFSGYCLNVMNHTLEYNGETIKLTRAEYELLLAFVTNPGKVLHRERLLRDAFRPPRRNAGSPHD